MNTMETMLCKADLQDLMGAVVSHSIHFHNKRYVGHQVAPDVQK